MYRPEPITVDSYYELNSNNDHQDKNQKSIKNSYGVTVIIWGGGGVLQHLEYSCFLHICFNLMTTWLNDTENKILIPPAFLIKST